MFKEMDKDNDGTIDVKEFFTGLQQLKLKGTPNFKFQIRFKDFMSKFYIEI